MNETKEKIKNVLILVLLLGMLYLIYVVWFFDSPFGDSGIYDLFGISSGEAVAEGDGSDVESFGIRPLGIFLRGEGFSRGAMYDTSASDEIYKTLRPVLAKALSGAKETAESTADKWNEALLGKGVLLDYKGNVPIEAVKLWLGANDGSSAVCGRYFMLSSEKRNVVIYVKNSESGAVYEIATALSSEELEKTASGISAPSAALAAEREEEDFAAVSSETVITNSQRKLPVISAYNSLVAFGTSVTNACLESFGILDASPSMYSEADNTAVYVADMITLRLEPAGIAEYSDSRITVDKTLGLGVEFEGQSPTLAEKTEAARALASGIASLLPGSGGIYIIDVYENGSETGIIFGRHIGGVPVDMNGSLYFARVNIEGSSIRRAQVNLRGYDISAQSTDVFSERLAAAAVNGSGKSGDLNLRYADDGGEAPVLSWFIGGAGKLPGEEAEDELVES